MDEGEDDGIQVPYHRGLKPLEKLLTAVRRPGDFFVRAAFETAMPRVEIMGVGTLSFPLPGAQVRQIIQQASRAPFGRGEETILDESVRKVWQLLPGQVRLGGKSWGKTFAGLLAAVTDGLGCGAEANVSAELYKLLVYDAGGFFMPHRDTEKGPGMFGTMIVVLPAAHGGGELIVRHAGRTVTLDLSGAEVSELQVAAFYADCEHEVRPITEGYRVCLVYNLIQRGVAEGKATLTAPAYHGEIEAAAKRLREAFAAKAAPAKLAWLFRHQYSPAGLSFAGLKGEDVALAKTLRRAAEAADCAVHLGIVHIEETGPAEANYDGYQGGWDYGGDEDEEDVDFEVVEVSDARWHVGEWHDVEDHPVDFGDLPLAEGEVLPAGALDGQEPDERRLLEATGNEGASFERSYHRAALVLWPRERFADVLLQAGVGAVLPHLSALVNDLDGGAGERKPVVALARRVVKQWEESGGQGPADVDPKKNPSRPEMIRLLVRLGDARLLERFVGAVVTPRFDGGENEALAAAAGALGPVAGARVFPALAWEKTAGAPRAVVGLLGTLVRGLGGERGLEARWQEGLTEMAAAIIAALPELKPLPKPTKSAPWWAGHAAPAFGRLLELVQPLAGQQAGDREEGDAQVEIVDAGTVTVLLASLRALAAGELRAEAVAAITGNTAVFDPVTVVVPALGVSSVGPDSPDAERDRLWRHAARFLLARSEQPPAPPADWAMKARVACACEDCLQLQTFAQDPVARVHRFRVKKERRQHLHRLIERLGLDMTHETERAGSPQTLVCTKTRRTYEGQCARHRADVSAMGALLGVRPPGFGEVAGLTARMEAAKGLKAGPG